MSTETISVLMDIHEKFSSLPATFREKVCEECNWSMPTFYRKMRGRDKPSLTDKSRIIPALSNAEKEKIIDIMKEVYTSAWDYMEKYRKA
ncbi:MAG TPA: hypothetical protein VM802_26830 [Chitinophaga sp.]|uniref:hypothetical protein n=1 Tax=Chitinophaga sp. TaxID=1869181 RepID=UPI002BA5027F|nr:hypothetical protein [Chitinophaga sp.]HVI48512.1 hypothetical protein [Chitinophaga sp.]